MKLNDVINGERVRTVEGLARVSLELARFLQSIKPHEKEFEKVVKKLKEKT